MSNVKKLQTFLVCIYLCLCQNVFNGEFSWKNAEISGKALKKSGISLTEIGMHHVIQYEKLVYL